MLKNMFFSRKKQILYYAFMSFTMIMSVIYMVSVQHNNLLGTFEFYGYNFIVRDIPIMILAGLCGFVPAMISFSAVLIDSICGDVTSAYSVSVYLMASFLYYGFSERRWYRKKGLTLLSVVISIGVLGGIWNIVDALASQQGLLTITSDMFIYYMICIIPETLFTGILLWLFYNYAPKQLRRAFYLGLLYEEDEVNEEILLYQQQVKSRLSRRLTSIIVIEAVSLGFCAAIFASQLLPSMADNIIGTGENTTESVMTYDWSADQETKTSEESSYNGTMDAGEQRFLFNNAGVAFLLKMVIMIINVSVPLIVLVNAFVQRDIARPIIAMSGTIKDFATSTRKEQEEKLRELSEMNIRGKDEIAVLYDNMAEMAYQINSFVDQTLREQKLEEDLRVAKIASENKSNFLNNVSHEIRTPINAVLGMDEMILRESSEKQIREYALDIQNSGKTLLSLVNDILDSSKLEAGKMEIIPVEYDVSSFINDMANTISLRAKEKNLAFEVHINRQIPGILYGDEIRIKQVMMNILTNAVKYTEKGKVIFWLDFEKKNQDTILLSCKVEDTGIGIKKEDMNKLFSRFERIDEGKNRTIEGTGLGMNIVKQLLALMGSKIEVESEYGKGSCFSFRIEQRVISWDEIGDYERSFEQSLENNRYEESFTAPEAKILVTDDTKMNLTVLKALLKKTKVQIETAESGFETLYKVKEEKYDVIFLDHRMPQMDGIETLHHMQTLEGNLNLHTPVISLTANAVSGARETYLAAGFVDYLSKPVDSVKLEKLLMEYLPKEKVLLTAKDELLPNHRKVEEQTAFEKVDSETVEEEKYSEKADEKTQMLIMLEKVRNLHLLDVDEAIKNCGSEEVFLEVLQEYVSVAEKKADDIEHSWQILDYDTYTVQTHALKSSSRLIGALDLSEKAKTLEEMGEKASKGDLEAQRNINEKTSELLLVYRELERKIGVVVCCDNEEETKEEISVEQLADAMAALKEFAMAFDFDSADSVIKMLDNYMISEQYRKGLSAVKDALKAVDRSLLIEKIDEMGL